MKSIIAEEFWKGYKQYLKDKKTVDENTTDSLEEFSSFLHNSGYSTYYAEQLYNIYVSKKLSFRKLKLRKQHPVRDFMLKKGSLLVAAMGGLVGAATISSLLTKWTATTKLLGFMPVAVEGVTILASVTTGIIGGAIITAILAKLNRKIPMWKNAHKYGKVKTNLIGKNGDLNALMQDIKNTTQQIYDLKEKKLFPVTRFFRRLHKNIHNRDRIHHLMKIRYDLLNRYLTSKDPNEKVFGSTTVKDALLKIENFINEDNSNSKKVLENKFITAMLKDKRLPVVENFDIYGDSTNKLIKLLAKKDKQLLSDIKKYAQSKHGSALNIYNDTDNLTSLIFGINNPNVENLTKKGNTLKISEKDAEFDLKNVINIENVANVKIAGNKAIIVYSDGSIATQTINPENKLINKITTDEARAKALKTREQNKQYLLVKEQNNQSLILRHLNEGDTKLLNYLKKKCKFDTKSIDELKDKVQSYQDKGRLIGKSNSKFKPMFKEAGKFLAKNAKNSNEVSI